MRIQVPGLPDHGELAAPIIAYEDPLSHEWSLMVIDAVRDPERTPYLAILTGWPHPKYRYERRFVGRAIVLARGTESHIVAQVAKASEIPSGSPLEYRGAIPGWGRAETGYAIFWNTSSKIWVQAVAEVQARARLAELMKRPMASYGAREEEKESGPARGIDLNRKE